MHYSDGGLTLKFLHTAVQQLPRADTAFYFYIIGWTRDLIPNALWRTLDFIFKVLKSDLHKIEDKNSGK